jgi:hypothetical protein
LLECWFQFYVDNWKKSNDFKNLLYQCQEPVLMCMLKKFEININDIYIDKIPLAVYAVSIRDTQNPTSLPTLHALIFFIMKGYRITRNMIQMVDDDESKKVLSTNYTAQAKK